ncbi:tRNA (adenosine(37)-N6)-threonylcarbamoyltransferase complex transferase subunit TsaD [Patescibacteria group bacterium]|nr:tRNA (adenosine(37)-N6)-threonylcarbamoyltransferase complex transferase subunit TsaD [Patescibacteria group bacterium]
MKILSIETSCDETAIALVEASGGIKRPRFKVLKNAVSSQVALHAPYGGVVPNIAKREHIKNLPIILSEVAPGKKVDVVAVTVGPGLEPALWTGIEFAKKLRRGAFPKAKLVGANHMEGHLYSFLLDQKTENPKSKILNPKIYPAVGLVVSGGHTILLLMKSLTEWKKLGETRDDAVGEAFDKVARMLGLPYPGGPEIQRAAATGNPEAVNFPRPMLHDKNYDFSFSGLKTSVLYYLRDHKNANTNDIAASFQKAAVDVLVGKAARAARQYKARSIVLAGGVAANASLRETLAAKSAELGLNFFAPSMQFNTDNAAMIAAAAYIQILKKKSRRMTAQANLSL